MEPCPPPEPPDPAASVPVPEPLDPAAPVPVPDSPHESKGVLFNYLKFIKNFIFIHKYDI